MRNFACKTVAVAGAISALTMIRADAQERAACPTGDPAAVVISTHGAVTFIDAGGGAGTLGAGDVLCPGDRVNTAERSGLNIRFDDRDSVSNILSRSTIVIPTDRAEADVALQSGLLRFISSVRGAFRVRTPQTDAGIDGTEAMIAVLGPEEDTLILVREGIVTATDRTGRAAAIALAAGQAAYASRTAALAAATPETVPASFRGFLLDPEGAADWAVYYPPILLGAGVRDDTVLRAAALLEAGDPDGAEALLAGYAGSDAAAANALGAVTAVYRNRVSEGLERGREAVRLDPGLAAAHVALGYALQASGEVEAARDATRIATEQPGATAYAWARLAELELTLTNRRAAVMAVEQSLSLADTSLGRAVLGFARLAAGDPESAAAEFGKAIALDDAAPLPRLGLGLTLLDRGDTAAGRRELETAAALDPQRAQLRGWLGRAYLEEGLSDKALAQFRLAQGQDPDDPTPWLFEAEERFAANQPIEALMALNEAEARADGRATVRGRAGLGEDAAAQSTAIGRIFDTLGFADQAFQAGARAVAADPTNPGAHRLLADLHRARPGNEIAQASERLQAQLLTGPTNAPIQPQLGEADLSLLDVGGAARVSFHEFNPLIQGDGFRALVSGLYGTQQTWSDEVSLTMKEGNVSVGVGQFHYETNGFLPNSGVTHDIASAEVRIEPVAGVRLFGEIKGRKTERGDREIPFSGIIDTSLRNDEERLTARLGAHIEATETIDVLVVGTLADVDTIQTSTTADDFGGGFVVFNDLNRADQTNGGDFQAQMIARFDRLTVQAGGSVLRLDTGGTNRLTTRIPFLGFVSATDAPVREFDRHYSAYLYGTLTPLDGVDLTLGLTVDHLHNERVERTQVNPKIAATIEPVDGFVLRGLYAKTLKRPFVLDQTLEPTTLAGFNQFFDDEDATGAEIYGVGADLNPFENLWIGAEAVYRDLDTPLPLFGGTTVQDFATEEWRLRGYANLALGHGFALSAGVEHTFVDSEVVGRVTTLRTTEVPVQLSYFNSSGLFATARGTYVRQSLADLNAAVPFRGIDDGVIVDLTAGFRLPNKRGVLSIEIQNLFDEDIRFQDEVTFTNRAVTPEVARERAVMGRFSLVLE